MSFFRADAVEQFAAGDALLPAPGELFFSANLRSFAPDAQLRECLAMREITLQSVPEDFKRPGHPPPYRARHVQR